MSESKLIWSRIEGKFVNGYCGKIDGITIFSIVWNSMTSDEEHWQLECKLVGMKDDLGRYSSISSAQTRATEALEYWLNRLGMKFK